MSGKNFDPKSILELALGTVAIAGLSLQLFMPNVTFVQIVTTMLVVLAVASVLFIFVWIRLEILVGRIEEKLEILESARSKEMKEGTGNDSKGT